MLKSLWRPLRKRYIYVFCLMACLFLIALFTGGPFTYSLFYIYVFTILISGVWCITSYRGIICRLEIEKDRLTVGEETIIRLTVKNTYPVFYPYVTISESFLGLMLDSTLHPLENRVVDKKFVPVRYGVYRLGPIKVDVKDGFRIFTYSQNIKEYVKIKVYPGLIPLKNLQLKAHQQFGRITVNDQMYEDYTSIADIRKYVSGDSLKKIHWRTSAKKAELYVKKFDQLADNAMSIFFDRYERHYIDEKIDEMAMECCASLIRYCFDMGIPVQVITSRNVIEAKGFYQFTDVMDQIILLEPKEDVKISDVIKSHEGVSYTGNSISIITPNLDTDLINRLMFLKAKGFGVILFLICRAEKIPKNLNDITFLNSSGINVKTLYVKT